MSNDVAAQPDFSDPAFLLAVENANALLGPLVDKWNLEAERLTSRSGKAHEYGEIVLWHRWIDANLSSAIRAHFVPDTKGCAEKLFTHPGGLSSFSQRTHLGRCMGLYGPITYSDLKIINDIRNGFAHPKDDESGQLEFFGFEHPQVSSECAKLRFLQNSWMTKHHSPPEGARDQYITTAKKIAVNLWTVHVVPKTLHGQSAEVQIQVAEDKVILP